MGILLVTYSIWKGTPLLHIELSHIFALAGIFAYIKMQVKSFIVLKAVLQFAQIGRKKRIVYFCRNYVMFLNSLRLAKKLKIFNSFAVRCDRYNFQPIREDNVFAIVSDWPKDQQGKLHSWIRKIKSHESCDVDQSS